MKLRRCLFCNWNFVIKRAKHWYCCKGCKVAGTRNGIKPTGRYRECIKCQCEFTPKNPRHVYCTPLCRYLHKTGRDTMDPRVLSI